ncbi:uncharacterized protein L203_103366 [Cryptococcus depauperatus CBS 7841]|uniref:Uncharacterized protein n=1 Tax=Cryptococcus depauperatus CBS 7841 TaxID=1295531 RepID=A0AAJ8M0N4_9TREE
MSSPSSVASSPVPRDIPLHRISSFLRTLHVREDITCLRDLLAEHQALGGWGRVHERVVDSSELPLFFETDDDQGFAEGEVFESSTVKDDSAEQDLHESSISEESNHDGLSLAKDIPTLPSPPRRYIQELSLDLNTLNSEAILALDLWRRRTMGIKALSMEFISHVPSTATNMKISEHNIITDSPKESYQRSAKSKSPQHSFSRTDSSGSQVNSSTSKLSASNVPLDSNAAGEDELWNDSSDSGHEKKRPKIINTYRNVKKRLGVPLRVVKPKAKDAEQPKRKPGRPKKKDTAHESTEQSKKRRGKPEKNDIALGFTKQPSRRGRPRKKGIASGFTEQPEKQADKPKNNRILAPTIALEERTTMISYQGKVTHNGKPQTYDPVKITTPPSSSSDSVLTDIETPFRFSSMQTQSSDEHDDKGNLLIDSDEGTPLPSARPLIYVQKTPKARNVVMKEKRPKQRKRFVLDKVLLPRLRRKPEKVWNAARKEKNGRRLNTGVQSAERRMTHKNSVVFREKDFYPLKTEETIVILTRTSNSAVGNYPMNRLGILSEYVYSSKCRNSRMQSMNFLIIEIVNESSYI